MVALAYISASAIPSRAANAMQTMKMAQALVGLDPDVLTIVALGQGESDVESLKPLYGLRTLPNIVRLSCGGRFGIHLFNVRAALAARRHGARLALSRSIGAAAISAFLGIPTVFECHAPPSGGERRYWSLLVNSPNFRRLVVISDALRCLIEQNFPDTRIKDMVVAHDGVDLEQFSSVPGVKTAKRKAGRDPARLVAGYAGHLYAGRGIEMLLACATALPAWDFIIAGGSESDVTELRNRVAHLNLTNIDLPGFVPNVELAGRLAIADVLLMPYQTAVMVSGGTLDTARWMSPLKMFEYMAMGRAIISSDLPVLREVLDDNMARLVAPDNTQSWIKALRSLESDSQRSALAQNARAAAQQYGWDRRTERMIADLLPMNQ